MPTDLRDLLCRTCLTSLTKNSSRLKIFHILHTEDLAKKLMLCSSLTVESLDEYPQQVCSECYNQIVIFYEFQQMCVRSLDKFKELLKNPKEVKENYDIDRDLAGENDPLDEDIKLNYVVEPTQLIEVSICTQSLVNTNVKQTSTKRKRGRPHKIRPEEKCEIARNKYNKTTNINFEVIPNDQIYVKHESELVSEDINQSKLNISNCSKNPGNETAAYESLNITEKASIEKHELIFSDFESDNDTKTTQKRTHQCDICNESFHVLHRLQAHKRQHNGLPAYSCTFEGCERSFNRWHYFNEHLKDHKGTHELYECDVDNCERVYKNKSALNIHKRKYHNQGPELKSHMCEVCGKVFKSSAVLNDHRFIHIDRTQYPFVCEEPNCTKRFTNKEKLKIHRMRHAGIKNFVCPYCGMRKTTRNELKIHINYHTLEKTWPCRFCSKVCNSGGNLKTHVRNIHERAKDYACQFCGLTFAKADTRKYHEMTHTGEKPHQCNECGRRFVQPAALRTHRKIHLKQKTKNSKDTTEQQPKDGEIHIAETEAPVFVILSDDNHLNEVVANV